MKKYDSAYVPAQPPKPTWGEWLRSLFGRKPAQRVRREPALVPTVEFWNETPPAVWEFRRRASEARMLLRRYVEDKPTSRRAWMADGHSQTSWQRARRMLMDAKILDREGNLLYTPRDASNRLDVYLGRMEAKIRAKSRFIAP